MRGRSGGRPRPSTCSAIRAYVGGVRTSDPGSSERPSGRVAAKAGFLASAFAVFTCGWLAMRSDDWKQMVLFSVLALGAAALASAFSHRTR